MNVFFLNNISASCIYPHNYFERYDVKVHKCWKISTSVSHVPTVFSIHNILRYFSHDYLIQGTQKSKRSYPIRERDEGAWLAWPLETDGDDKRSKEVVGQ